MSITESQLSSLAIDALNFYPLKVKEIRLINNEYNATFKVVTNAATKVITIRPYKESAMTTQIGSDLTHTATSAIVSPKFGVVLGPSDQVQGDKLDDFNISSN